MLKGQGIKYNVQSSKYQGLQLKVKVSNNQSVDQSCLNKDVHATFLGIHAKTNQPKMHFITGDNSYCNSAVITFEWSA